MKLIKTLLVIFSMAVISACSNSHVKTTSNDNEKYDRSDIEHYKDTEKFYSIAINENPVNVAKLNLFLTLMPKGGDLHHHYSGSIYAETYLDWVGEKGWRIDKCTFKIISSKQEKGTGACPLLDVKDIKMDSALYGHLLSLWSDKDYSNHFHHQPPPDIQIFSTFSYFGLASNEYMHKGLAIIKQRAKAENVDYIETIIAKVGIQSNKYFTTNKIKQLNIALRSTHDQEQVNKILDEITSDINNNAYKKKRFSSEIKSFVKNIDTEHKGIDDDRFTMRFQTYAMRNQNPVQVFIDLYSGYLSAKKSPLIVGVNIVGAENNPIALSNYTLDMRMYNYLSNKYPKVKRTLHAGELTLGMVRPKDLGFHINQAVQIAKAQRIGHGVDISYESKPLVLLEKLKKNHVAIEINLTSNEFILDVKKGAHPYQIYAAYGVPIVISSDDSGVSRNNLSNEYMLLASRYKPSYAVLKSYVYNSINYSFLSPEDKKKHLALLDNEFKVFELKISKLKRKIN
ncbi:MAG: hypothetical protein KAH18_03870 [Psychromonas sp.]|nr:hypothetical protein [Psychromonas sp.]